MLMPEYHTQIQRDQSEAVQFRVPSKGVRFPPNTIWTGNEPGSLTRCPKSNSLSVVALTDSLQIVTPTLPIFLTEHRACY